MSSTKPQAFGFKQRPITERGALPEEVRELLDAITALRRENHRLKNEVDTVELKSAKLRARLEEVEAQRTQIQADGTRYVLENRALRNLERWVTNAFKPDVNFLPVTVREVFDELKKIRGEENNDAKLYFDQPNGGQQSH